MFKRILLALTFIATLAVTGLSVPSSANAWWYGYSRPYASYYYGTPRYYSYYSPYRTYYYAPYSTYYYGQPVYRTYSTAYYPGAYYYGPMWR
jgi:hypothetical protein